jgi:hypothetical protein
MLTNGQSTDALAPAAFHPCPPDPGCRFCAGTDGEAADRDFDWSFLDAAYCISLWSRKDRAASAAAELHRVGLCRRTMFYRPVKHPTKASAGIWDSHRTVARRALAKGQARVLILEDDVLFSRYLRPRTVRAIGRALANLPRDWMIFYLGHWAFWAYFVRPNVLRLSAGCAHAYVAGPRLLRWLDEHPFGTPGVDRMRPMGRGLDAAYARLEGAYAFFPMIAIQSASRSDHGIYTSRNMTKLRHLYTRNRHRDIILSKLMWPNQFIVVCISPLVFLVMRLKRLMFHLIRKYNAIAPHG